MDVISQVLEKEPIMPSLTDYQVLQDKPIFLQDPPQSEEPDHIKWNWTRPDDLHITSQLVRSPILSFKVRVFELAHFFVKMNGLVIIDQTELAVDNIKVWWEVFSWRSAFPSGSTISKVEPIELFLDGGRIKISDVVIWFQIDV